MKRTLYCYRIASAGATLVQNALNERNKKILRVTQDSQRITNIKVKIHQAVADMPNPALDQPNLIINWGADSQTGGWYVKNLLVLNGRHLNTNSNKKFFFDLYKNDRNLNLPKTYTRNEAIQAVANAVGINRPVLVERHNLAGHSGDGIRLVSPNMQISNEAKLYVEYIPKKSEFRAHIFKGLNKIVWQEKRLRRDARDNGHNEDRYKIRNWDNGWVFCRENLQIPAAVIQQAENFKNSEYNNLDFCAIDIIYNERNNKAYILEANTAPGIEGQTLDDYATAFIDYERTHDWNSNNEGRYTRAA